MKKIFKNQIGDTIVEVLVAVSVVSLVLSASYTLANRSTQANRQAQERGEALKLTEAQLERLKAYLTENSLNEWSNTNKCFDENGVIVPDNQPDEAHRCKDPEFGRYEFTIKNDLDDEDKYIVTTVWDPVTGGADKENLSITYRIHPASNLNFNSLP